VLLTEAVTWASISERIDPALYIRRGGKLLNYYGNKSVLEWIREGATALDTDGCINTGIEPPFKRELKKEGTQKYQVSARFESTIETIA
jgi:hypothetical protein